MSRFAPIVVLAFLLVSCGLPETPLVGGPVMAAECGPISMEWPIPDPPDADFEPFEGDIEEYVDDNARIEFDMDTPTIWTVVDESGSGLLLFGRPVDQLSDGPGYRFARFEKVDDGWRASAWGGCQIEATAAGYGIATFQLDPNNEPDPAAMSFGVLANERACASGEPPTDREVAPVVVESDRYIDVTILVADSASDGETCPSNPDFPLTVELDQPVGSRIIRDLSIPPAQERTWPPDPIDN